MKRKAAALAGDQLALLRYRSNLLGADLRITNFGGGNTSSKIDLRDPFTGKPVRVLAVKGSGGDLGSIKESGFALLYLDRLEQLKGSIGARRTRTRWFVSTRSQPSAKTRWRLRSIRHCTLFFPFACRPFTSRLGDRDRGQRQRQAKAGRVQQRIRSQNVWLPWQRPGFELALCSKRR